MWPFVVVVAAVVAIAVAGFVRSVHCTNMHRHMPPQLLPMPTNTNAEHNSRRSMVAREGYNFSPDYFWSWCLDRSQPLLRHLLDTVT